MAAQEGPEDPVKSCRHKRRGAAQHIRAHQGVHMGRRIRHVIVGSIAAAALIGFGSVGALASHGGGGGGGGAGTSSGSCSLSPATVWGSLTIYGHGFTPGV